MSSEHNAITLPEQQHFIDHYAGPTGHAPRITELGYATRNVPPRLYAWLKEKIDATWKADRSGFVPEMATPQQSIRSGLVDERWDVEQPPEHAEMPSFINAGDQSYSRVLRELHAMHEEWAGIRLVPAQYWGPRVYQRHAVLARHIDIPTTHVVSGSITIASQLEQPWPLMLEHENGTVVEVELEPGEMLLYEGSRLPHYRPKPLVGEYYINLYVHYFPRDATFNSERGAWEL